MFVFLDVVRFRENDVFSGVFFEDWVYEFFNGFEMEEVKSRENR